MAVLGEGAFGLVKLVRLKSNPTATWAFKCMQKQRIVATKQQANVMREKTLLAQARHPFLLRLEATMQDQHCLYMLCEFLQGGDLFSHIVNCGGILDHDATRFYVGGVTLVFEYLHERSVVYRDLKPENLVLDNDGPVRKLPSLPFPSCCDRSL